MDDSIDSEESGESESDIAVDIKTLQPDGIRPAVGDRVDVAINGVVRQIVDQTAFVTPETANGQPIAPAQPAQPTDVRAAAMQQDMLMPGY